MVKNKTGELNRTRKLNIAYACLAGVLTLAIYLVVLCACHVTPFGNETFLMYDMKRQYINYYAYMKSIWNGENNLVYSFSTALGSAMCGFDIYYISSPFLLLLLPFPNELLPMGVSLVIGIKLAVSAMIMYAFLLSRYRGRNSHIRYLVTDICAISWAMSGFLFAHSMNMMWIDVVMLLPIIIWTLEHMLKKCACDDKKYHFCSMLPYTFVLAYMLICNYYITYGVLIFVGLWTIKCLWASHDKHPIRQILRVMVATIVSVMLDAFVLIPTAIELANSPKDITKLGLELTGKNLIIRDVLSKLPTMSYDYIEARFGLPQVYCGVLMLFLALLYFFVRRIPAREKIGRGVIAAFLLASFCIDGLNLFWHAGMEPSGHPYRQAYMWVFLMILCSYDTIIDYLDSADTTDNGFKYYPYISLACVTVIIGVIFYEVLRLRYDHISTYTIAVNWGLLAVYALIIVSLIAVRKCGQPIKRLEIALLAVTATVLVGELCANAGYTYIYQSMNNEDMSDYRAKVVTTESTVKKVTNEDTSFYRMENLNPRQQNDAMQFGYNGVTHYSSAGMIYVRYFLQRLGFNDDELYTHYGYDNTATADSLLGIRYILSDGVHDVHEGYEKCVDGEVSAYRNPWALPIALGVNGYDLNKISSTDKKADSNMTHVPDMSPFDLQEDIYSRLCNKDVSLFTKASVTTKDISSNDKKAAEYYINTMAEGNLYMYVDNILGYNQSLAIYVNDELLTSYGNASCLKVLNLGTYDKGDSIKVTIDSDDPNAILGDAVFVTEDINALQAAYNMIVENGADICKLSSSHLSITGKKTDGVFLTIPYEEGWHIRVNGRITEPVAVYDSMMYIPYTEDADEYNIDMIFIPVGMIAGSFITIVAIILVILAVAYTWVRKQRRVSEY